MNYDDGMRGLLLGALACALALGVAAQPPLAAEPRSRHEAPPPAQENRPFAAPPHRSAEAERCATVRRELRAARRAEREAGTTTSGNQAAMREQHVVEAMQKAGC